MRACLGKKKMDRRKYAVETKRAKNSSFDVVGSQQSLKAFDRKEVVKCVKRNLIPCVHTVGLHCLYCLHEGVCVCACACFVKQDMKVKRERAVQIAQDNMLYLLTVQCATLYCLHCP